MSRLQLSQEALISSQLHQSNSINKNRGKQNDAKYLNAIKPYITKERKNSKRQIHPKVFLPIPLQNSKSKSRRNDSYRNIQNTINSKQLGDIYQELISLKAQYHSLKVSYNVLVKQKETKQKETKQKESKQTKTKHSVHNNEISKRTLQLEKANKQIQKYKSSITTLQQQAQRSRKQYTKFIQIQKARTKKFQQTLQQKQLMIAFLRSQLANNSIQPASIDQSITHFFFQNTAPISSEYPNNSIKGSQNHSVISALPSISQIPIKQIKKQDSEDDSLSFSRDKSKQFQSVNSIASNNDNTVLTFTKKDVIILDDSGQNIQTNNQGQEDCLTFQNRKNQQNKVINLPIKTKTKRILQINTDQNSKYQKCIKEGQSLQTRKKSNKQKKKVSKKKKDLKQQNK